MVEVIGVRFESAGRIYYYDRDKHDVEIGTYVIVETSRGIEFGKVVMIDKKVESGDIVLPVKKVIRIANEEDKMTVRNNQEQAKKAFTIGNDKIREHRLEMNLVDVTYTLDRNKVIFYFTADGRVDFRNLVKDLAAIFKTRIELRQIGVRDEAKMLGGIGPCGRMLCCSTFLGEFEPVSIKMAKDQNLSLNPAKISGLCGRLMCCLKYENDAYEEAKHLLPDVGKRIDTPYGRGRVTGLNMLERLVRIKIIEEDRTIEYTIEELMEAEMLPVQATR